MHQLISIVDVNYKNNYYRLGTEHAILKDFVAFRYIPAKHGKVYWLKQYKRIFLPKSRIQFKKRWNGVEWNGWKENGAGLQAEN